MPNSRDLRSQTLALQKKSTSHISFQNQISPPDHGEGPKFGGGTPAIDAATCGGG